MKKGLSPKVQTWLTASINRNERKRLLEVREVNGLTHFQFASEIADDMAREFAAGIPGLSQKDAKAFLDASFVGEGTWN